MPRVKRGTIKLKRRKNILARTKGFRFGRSTKEAQAKEALVHAGKYAFMHRKDKKSERRRINQVKINAGSRSAGLSYSKFMGGLKKKGIALDRKILAILAEKHPTVFAKIIAEAK